jgi:hypothetical protein
VTPLRMPGAVPPETHQAALDRLAEAMIMTSTIKRVAADSYRMMLRVAITAAPYGEQGAAVEKILQQLLKRLDAHLATVPNAPLPPPGAA